MRASAEARAAGLTGAAGECAVLSGLNVASGSRDGRGWRCHQPGAGGGIQVGNADSPRTAGLARWARIA